MATKRSAPTQPKGVSNNSISYGPISRLDHQVPGASMKSQPSSGGLNQIDGGKNPETGTTTAP